MSKACFVCKVLHLEMISIFQHPEKLDSILNYLLGLQAKQDDYLCKDCCEEVINAFQSKQKFNQFNAKTLQGGETLFKEEINFPGRIEAVISQVPEVKIEQNNEELERSFHELSKGTEPKKLIEKVGTGEDTKQEPVARRNFVDSYKDEGAKNDEVLKKVTEIETVTVDLEQISGKDSQNCRDKVETLSDVEDSNDEFDLNGAKESINYTKENEVVLENTGEEPLIYTNEKLCTAERPFTCCYCSKTFITRSKLKEHVSIHMKEKSHLCSDCGKAFKFLSALKQHRRIHTGEKPYTCSYCSKTYRSYSSLYKHIRTHSNEKPHGCSKCGKRFTTSTSLKSHEKIHTGEKPYICSYCPKAFCSKSNLTVHVRRHMNDRSHICPDCGKGFISSRTLRYHRTVHTGERAYTCRYCFKTFATSSAVSRHKNIHEKRFECSVCGKYFITPSRLKDHSSVHTGETPYACSYCPKTFSSNNYLKTHLLRHTKKKSHICVDCGKGFIFSQGLKRHRIIHTGERPYACHECSKTFSQRSTLRKHKRTHTKEKPFRCSQCEQSFFTLPSLKKHKRIHTGEIPCLYCSKTFKKSSNHLLHIQSKHAKEVNSADSEKMLHQSTPSNSKSPMSDVAVSKNQIDLVDQTEIEIKSECKDELENMLKTNNLELGNQPETTGNAEICTEAQNSVGVTIKTENESVLSNEMSISSPHISEVTDLEMDSSQNRFDNIEGCQEFLRSEKSMDIKLEVHHERKNQQAENSSVLEKQSQKVEIGGRVLQQQPIKQKIINTIKQFTTKPHVYSASGKLFVVPEKLKIHKKIVCSECGKGFITMEKLTIHTKTHKEERST